MEKTSQEGVRQRLEDDFNCRPVFLERDLVEAFYARFCHGVLWPLFHSLPTDVTGRTDLYEAYVQANQKYLEAVALEYQEGDVVLVHDYELMLLPAMIRGRFPDAPVGFFCHCPYENGVLSPPRGERELMKTPSTRRRTQVPLFRVLPHASGTRGVAARRPRRGPDQLQPLRLRAPLPQRVHAREISASRRVVVSSLHPYDSCPSHDDVGGFFFEFEAVRTNRDAPRRC